MLREALRAPAVYSDTGFRLAALPLPPAWHTDGLCKEPAYRHLPWFPEPGDNTAAVRAVCARCLVAAECLSAGLHEAHGVWAGTTPRERQRLRLTAA